MSMRELVEMKCDGCAVVETFGKDEKVLPVGWFDLRILAFVGEWSPRADLEWEPLRAHACSRKCARKVADAYLETVGTGP